MKNRAFTRWRHLTTTSRILEGFAFLWKLGASLSLRRAGRREPWERGCAGITKFKYERKNEKDSGRSSKMTPYCKWPIARIRKTYCSMNVIYFLRSIFKNKTTVSIFKQYLCAHPKGGIFEPVLCTIVYDFLIFKTAAESNGVTTLKIKPLPHNLCKLLYRKLKFFWNGLRFGYPLGAKSKKTISSIKETELTNIPGVSIFRAASFRNV